MPDDSTENEAIYDKKVRALCVAPYLHASLFVSTIQVEDLERLLDAPLHVLYLKQLSLVRERSFKTFKEALAADEEIERTGEVYRADDVHAWVERLARGQDAARPKPWRRWRHSPAARTGC